MRELPLVGTAADRHHLAVRLDVARQASNSCLDEALRRLDLLRASKASQAARALPRGEPKSPAAATRTRAFAAANQAVGFAEYALHRWATAPVSHTWLGDHFDANTVQALATRAFQAAPEHAFGNNRASIAPWPPGSTRT